MLYPASTFLRNDPFRLMRRLNEELDRGFSTARPARGYPAVNIWTGSDATAVTAELPGVDADDIDISVKDTILTVTGKRARPQTDEKAVWHMRERAFGEFSRAIRLSFQADPNNVEARLENGVLQIVVHRREEDKPRRIEVKTA